MNELTGGYLQGKLSEKEYAKRIESVQRFERQLTDNGYLVVKLFLNISKKEQEKRISRLTDEKDTAWRLAVMTYGRMSIMRSARKYFRII